MSKSAKKIPLAKEPQGRDAGSLLSAWSPLRESVFRALWIATAVSNVGTWMQDVGESWLMTSLTALDFDASRATATNPALGQYRYVHFATHGFLDAAHPELSGIVLSLVNRQGSEQDGFLWAHEVYGLRLPVEMVALSGCRTGLGKEIKGEGLMGLTRGFMYAGAARVLVSLRDIDDEASSELMARLYKAILKEHMSPAAALRTAQIDILKEKRWQAPYYWAAFVLQGEPR